jgi:tRNA 2-thiouridine synthesizing protein A
LPPARAAPYDHARAYAPRCNHEAAMTAIVLDTKGLNCPLPILKAKKAMRDVPAGGVLQVLATDPGALKDFEAFCRTTGNQLVDWSEAGGVWTINLKKAA